MAIARDLLTTIRRVTKQLGLPVPTSAASSDFQTQQLVALANETGAELMREVDWPILKYTATITTVATIDVYTVAAGDYSCDRIVPLTEWDATNQWRFIGALDDAAWAQWQYGVVTQPIRKVYRQIAPDQIQLYPVPVAPAGESLTVLFITDLWALNSTLSPLPELASDTDTHVFDASLFDLGLKWRFLRAKRLSYDEEYERYNRTLRLRKGAASTPRRLNLAGPTSTRHFVDYQNVPDTGYGV